MQQLALTDIFRFLFPGVVAYGLLYLFDPDTAKNVRESAGDVGLFLILLTAGSLMYHFYRSIIYNPLILRFLDWNNARKNRMNHRRYLGQMYAVRDRQDAELVWTQIRNASDTNRFPSRGLYASGIHSLFMASILGLAFVTLACLFDSTPQWTLYLIILVSSLFIFCAAVRYNLFFESLEYLSFRTVNKDEINAVVHNLPRRTPEP